MKEKILEAIAKLKESQAPLLAAADLSTDEDQRKLLSHRNICINRDVEALQRISDSIQ